MPGCWMKVILQILPKIGYHGNVPWGIGKTGPDWQKFMQYTFHLVKKKIVKICPVYPELALLNLKKETEGKI